MYLRSKSFLLQRQWADAIETSKPRIIMNINMARLSLNLRRFHPVDLFRTNHILFAFPAFFSSGHSKIIAMQCNVMHHKKDINSMYTYILK